jgi:hypothetical protein
MGNSRSSCPEGRFHSSTTANVSILAILFSVWARLPASLTVAKFIADGALIVAAGSHCFMWSDTKVGAPIGCAPALEAKVSLDPSTWRSGAPAHGCWVKRAPAVSILQSGTATEAFAGRLSERHARVFTVNFGGANATNGSTLDQPKAVQYASDFRSAVADTDVSLIEHGDGPCALAELIGVASRLGCELALKPAYHVVVLAGGRRTVKSMLMVAEAIENASGKHLGPDFGLCLVLGLAGQMPTCSPTFLAPTILATDRRAGETVRVLFDVLDADVTLKPLFLQQGEPC